MSLTAIFVTHNSVGSIGDALASAARALPDAELVVVDNASTDGTVESLREDRRVLLVAQPENEGFGRACNAGAEAAGGTHLLFLNPDVELASVNAAALAEALAAMPFGVLGATYELPNGRHFDGLRAESGLAREIVSHVVGPLRPREVPRRPPRSGGDRPWVAGAALLVRRDEFLALGGFDRRFFLYHEDRDLSARYRAAGLPVGATPALVVRHRGGGSSGEDDLRVIPAAWELLSWIEYVHGRDGPRAARRAARITLTGIRSLTRGLVAFSRAGVSSSRTRRKAEQLESVLTTVRELRDTAGSRGFCPHAVEHLRAGR